MIFLFVAKGVQSTGKVVYLSTTFPYVVLIILGIQGWRLEGASIGIEYYLVPKLEKLADIGVYLFIYLTFLTND